MKVVFSRDCEKQMFKLVKMLKDKAFLTITDIIGKENLDLDGCRRLQLIAARGQKGNILRL